MSKADFLAALVLALAAFSSAIAAVAQDGPPTPPTAIELCLAATALHDDGEYTAAIDTFTKALEQDALSVDAFVGRARSYEEIEEPTPALRDLQRALELEPDHAAARFARGRVLTALGDEVLALRDFDRAAELMPDNAAVFQWRGDAHATAERLELAAADFLRASTLDETDAWSIGRHGHVLWILDRSDAARDALRRSLELDPQLAWVHHTLATLELELGDPEEALRCVDNAIRLEPDIADYHWTRGNVLEQTGRFAQAHREYERAATLDPEYAAYLTESTDPKDALRSLGVLLALVVGLLTVLSLIGLVFAPGANDRLEHGRTGQTPASYDGQPADLFKIYIQNIVLTVVTLGIYRFWAQVRMTRFRYQHTEFAGGRFDYHATGQERFFGFCKGLALLAPALLGLYFLDQVLSEPLGERTAFTICFWSFFVLLFLLRPLFLVGSQRFNMSRTSWNNLRFRFTGKVGDAYRLYLRDFVLLIGTLGFYFAWHQVNVRRFRLQNTKMGELGFGYRGDGGALFGQLCFGTILCYITLGIYTPWQIAKLHKYHVDHTTFRDERFQSSLTGGRVMRVGAPALLAIIVTLGLAIPWAITRWHRLLTDTTGYRGEFDAATLASIHDAAANSLVDGVGEAGDALAELGNLFGA